MNPDEDGRSQLLILHRESHFLIKYTVDTVAVLVGLYGNEVGELKTARSGRHALTAL